MENYNGQGIWEAPLRTIYNEDCVVFGGNYNENNEEENEEKTEESKNDLPWWELSK